MNEFVLIKKDVNETYMNKVELEFCLEGLTNEISFCRQLYEGEIHDLQSQIFDMSTVLSVELSVDNNFSLDLDDIIAEIKVQFKEITDHSRAKAEMMYQTKYEELQTLACKQGDDLNHMKMEISQMN